MSYSTILHFRGYTIIVEDYMYYIKHQSYLKFITLDDVINHIDNVEKAKEELDKLKTKSDENI